MLELGLRGLSDFGSGVGALRGPSGSRRPSVMVAMVQVREVRVAVAERLVQVAVAVRLPGRSSRRVSVVVVLVVDVGVSVLERLVLMLVLVPLGEMEPHPGSHERRGEEGAPVQRLVERDGGDDRAHERGGREVRSGPGAAQTTKGEDEQDEARAVSEEADDTRADDGRGGPARERAGSWPVRG